MSHIDTDKLSRYDQLIARNKAVMLRVCQLYARRDREQARDLYQDISLRLWVDMDTFKQQSSEATWVWRLAVNLALDWRRLELRRPEIVLSDSLPEPPVAEQCERLDHLYEAIARLPVDDQFIVSARLDGSSYQDLAALTGLREGTLRVRYNRIVNQLKDMLKGK